VSIVRKFHPRYAAMEVQMVVLAVPENTEMEEYGSKGLRK
jgi:hypothetical protein